MKRRLITLFPVLICAGLLFGTHARADISNHSSATTVSADEALARLLAGNKRFVTGAVVHPGQDAARRIAQAKGQTPSAIVLACSDSRVPPELIFDQGIGDIFVIRNAGNLLDDHVLGSMEYAVSHLRVPLIVVLGHAKCGAVSAAVGGGHAPGHIHSIVESIEPAVKAVHAQEGDTVDNVVRANASRIREALTDSKPLIGDAVRAGQLKIVAGRYDITSGEVAILP